MKTTSIILAILAMASAAALFSSCCSGSKTEPEIDNYPKVPAPEVWEDDTDPSDNLTVFYEVNPKLFASSKALNAIKTRLPQIRELGTTVLWLMPIQLTGSKNAVGSPYCIRDYYSLSPSYGSTDDLKSLIEEAHKLGMRVIMDWVANHTSWDNAWVNAHPDWYTQVGGQIISPAGTGWNDVADLNYDNKEMRKAMTDAMLYWINEAGIDGYRCDAVDYVPVDYWTEAIAQIRKAKPDALMLAESSDSKYFRAGFDYAYGWPYQSALKQLFKEYKVADFYGRVINEENNIPYGKHLMRFTTNHDQASEEAPASVYGNGNQNAALAAFAITAFIGESPLIYSSQETGYAQKINFFSNLTINWDANPKITSTYKELIRIANITGWSRRGERKLLDTGEAVTILWTEGGRSLLVSVNPTSHNVVVSLPEGITVNGSKKFLLPPYSHHITQNI